MIPVRLRRWVMPILPELVGALTCAVVLGIRALIHGGPALTDLAMFIVTAVVATVLSAELTRFLALRRARRADRDRTTHHPRQL